MAAPVQLLRDKYKLDAKSLAAYFDVMTLKDRKEVEKLVCYIRDCIRNGIDRNRKDYRLFKAMDWAYDTPFYQVSYTQLRGLLNSKPDDKKVLEVVKQWGLTHLLPDIVDANGCATCDPVSGAKLKSLNLPVFFNIFIPLVMAYVTIRWAKLFNERNLVPLYKYEPVQFTKENRARCEILTQAVQRQSAWFDYSADEAQSILQMLNYGFCINFPREAWYVEKQLGEDGKEKLVKEGVRFNMPHPSRVYWDLFDRQSTLNTGTGCGYAGYWELCRYRDIKNAPLYFNKDHIVYGGSEYFDLGGSDFLEQVFPCNMSFARGASAGAGLGGTGALDRQSEASYYSDNDGDTATLKTEHFAYLVPKDWGLGDYPHKILMRFVVAGCDTIIWAEPLPYSVIPTYQYDADNNRSRFNSLNLQVIPFQDQIGNLFSQWIYSVRENLRNPIFYDKDKVPTEYVQQLQNMGNKMMDGRAYIPYSSTVFQRMGERQQEAFFTPPFARHNTAELASLISGILDMLERTLQFSSQELGQPATHEQTAEESRIIARYTENRVELTGSFIDRAIYAKKSLLYDAMMAYADKEIAVGISSSFAATEEEFKKLIKAIGFTIDDESTFDPDEPDSMRKVKGDKSHLILETFASTRDARNRIDNPQIADAMSKIFLAIAGNPVLIQSIGSVQLVELLNQIVVAAGLPKEFKLRGKKIDTNAPPEEQAQQTAQLITEFSKQVKEAIDQKQVETLQAAGEQTTQIVSQALQAAGQQTSQALVGIAQGLEKQGELNEAQSQALQQQQQQLQQLALAVAELTQKINLVTGSVPPMAGMTEASL